jgi:hypothetical protein
LEHDTAGRTVKSGTFFSGPEHRPGQAALERHLKIFLGGDVEGRVQEISLQREPNLLRGAFPSEIVTWLGNSGRKIQVLLKYHVPDIHTGYGYWGDVEYEATVYRVILETMPLSLPRFYGLITGNDASQQCLIVEYIPESTRLNKCPIRTIVHAARWLGRFHALASPFVDIPSASFLHRYGEEYFAGWARRTLEYARPIMDRYPWLPGVAERFLDVIPTLLQGSPTVVHGEFYPHNIVVRSDVPYPVDWASAAIGRGEIDLASLTDGWGHDALIEECEEEYAKARWPDGPPTDYQQVLALARVYWPLRWLGDKPEQILHPKRVGYPVTLEAEAKRAGLL